MRQSRLHAPAQHGRGFAVVAGEVGKLATRAAAATREITAIMTEIRSEVGLSGAAVQRSIEAVQAGAMTIDAATNALAHLTDAIEHAAQIADRVATGTNAMHAASAQLAVDVAGVSLVVEENAVASQRMQTTSQLVTSAMLPIAGLAETQASSAAAAARSAQLVGARVDDMAHAATNVRTQAESLSRSFARFELNDARRNGADRATQQVVTG